MSEILRVFCDVMPVGLLNPTHKIKSTGLQILGKMLRVVF